jgi:hypothetical protein
MQPSEDRLGHDVMTRGKAMGVGPLGNGICRRGGV